LSFVRTYFFHYCLLPPCLLISYLALPLHLVVAFVPYCAFTPYYCLCTCYPCALAPCYYLHVCCYIHTYCYLHILHFTATFAHAAFGPLHLVATFALHALLLPSRMLPLHLCALLLPSHLLLPLCLEPCCCLHAYCWLCACCPHAFTPSYYFRALCLALPFSNTYSPPFPPSPFVVSFPCYCFHTLCFVC